MQNLDNINAAIETILRKSRIPGAAIAVVEDGKTIFAQGYGYRDLAARRPMDSNTVYPIASTSKAFNATLIGMLVDEGKLAWDAPVQEYLPGFRLGDDYISAHVTLRDLMCMRTGLPRHDWLWVGNATNRADLVARLRYLELSAGFREKYQYNNLTVTTAGYVAEVVTGRTWEDLIRERIFEPLKMSRSGFAPPADNATLSYYENSRRQLLQTRRLAAESTAPSGGSIHSTVEDMARWALFHLNGGQVDGRALIKPEALKETQTPQMVVPFDPLGRLGQSTYGMGWSIAQYHGFQRISHGGYLHDVASEVMLFPEKGLGLVAFSNFGPTLPGQLLCEHALEATLGWKPYRTLEWTLELYEKKIADTRERNTNVRRVANTAPSHGIESYAGVYEHPGYGRIEIRSSGKELSFHRYTLVVPLEHWHYDQWAFVDDGQFWIHDTHIFDRTHRLLFEANGDGEIFALTMRMEPTVAPIQFIRK